jgi:tRNA A37 threonylcarbamoyltransferase TsaD
LDDSVGEAFDKVRKKAMQAVKTTPHIGTGKFW